MLGPLSGSRRSIARTNNITLKHVGAEGENRKMNVFQKNPWTISQGNYSGYFGQNKLAVSIRSEMGGTKAFGYQVEGDIFLGIVQGELSQEFTRLLLERLLKERLEQLNLAAILAEAKKQLASIDNVTIIRIKGVQMFFACLGGGLGFVLQ